MLVHPERQIVERILWIDKKESTVGRAPDLTHARQVAQRTLGHERQALDDQRRQIILQHHILKIAVKLRDGLLGAANRSELARMLDEQSVVERMHVAWAIR